jgi:gluconate 5-dehydrogenase
MTVREMFELEGRVALITGGSRGLGLQIATGLGEMGAKIAISARKADELAEAKQALEAKGIETFTVVNDLANPEAALPLTETVASHYGTIDILVNNAGTTWGAPAEQHPLPAWNKVMALNTTSVFTLSQAVANRCFIPRRSGNIIVIASTAALRVGGGLQAVAYSASKAGVLHLMRDIEKQVIARTPLGRMGDDTDLMGAAVFLASNASRHITGQYIAVDGGSASI